MLKMTTGKSLDLTILAPLPAWKRIQKLMSAINIPDLLFTLVPTSLKKVGVALDWHFCVKFISTLTCRDQSFLSGLFGSLSVTLQCAGLLKQCHIRSLEQQITHLFTLHLVNKLGKNEAFLMVCVAQRNCGVSLSSHFSGVDGEGRGGFNS